MYSSIWSIRTHLVNSYSLRSISIHFGPFVLILVNSYSCTCNWSGCSHFGTSVLGYMQQWAMTDHTHPCVSPFGQEFRIREAILDKIMNLNPFKIQWWSVRQSIYPINSRLRSEEKKILSHFMSKLYLLNPLEYFHETSGSQSTLTQVSSYSSQFVLILVNSYTSIQSIRTH